MALSIISTTYGLSMSTINQPIWHIAGIGALGSLIASYFFHAGHPVHLLLKNKQQLADYEQSQLTVITDTETSTAHPPASEITCEDGGHINHLICCVKTYEINPLLMRLQHRLDQKSIIILIHNGLGVLDEIQISLPHLRIVSGICTLGAFLEKPFNVRAFLKGAFHLGSVKGDFTIDEVETIRHTFQTAKLPYQWEQTIQTMMWEKFALNCSINILTALLSCKNGDLLSHLELLKDLTAEIARVLSAYHKPVSADELFLNVTRLLHRVGENYSSMYKDVQMNRPTEIAYLNAYLVKLAHEKNIPTPLNQKLLSQLEARRVSCL